MYPNQTPDQPQPFSPDQEPSSRPPEQATPTPVQTFQPIAPPITPSAPAFVPVQPPVQSTAAPQQPTVNPGHTLGVVGFILSFFISLAGLVVSIIALVKSRKAGFKNPLAVAGIVIGSVFSVGALLIIPMITIVAFAGVQTRASTLSAQSSAEEVVKDAEAIHATSNAYPDSVASIQQALASQNLLASFSGTQATSPMTSKPTKPATFEFYTCKDSESTGNKVGYWDYTTDSAKYLYAGSSSFPEGACTFVAS